MITEKIAKDIIIEFTKLLSNKLKKLTNIDLVTEEDYEYLKKIKPEIALNIYSTIKNSIKKDVVNDFNYFPFCIINNFNCKKCYYAKKHGICEHNCFELDSPINDTNTYAQIISELIIKNTELYETVINDVLDPYDISITSEVKIKKIFKQAKTNIKNKAKRYHYHYSGKVFNTSFDGCIVLDTIITFENYQSIKKDIFEGLKNYNCEWNINDFILTSINLLYEKEI